ncbi:phosphodiester glycosidase family protein [bacterium]|nr:phosphodiester glycosidase family protein [candidate division CSSED10-310 bacterium]
MAEDGNLTWTVLSDDLMMMKQTVTRYGTTETDTVHFIRFEQSRWRFSPFYYKDDAFGQRLNAMEWLTMTGASVMINAGQYDTSLKHLGWFIRNSVNLGSSKHPIWKGLLVNGSRGNDPVGGMHIIDLQTTALSYKTMPYSNVVQSLMLFDQSGTIRVNRTGKTARRCVVAEGKDKYIYLILTEGDWTLWELARYLLSGNMAFKQAMSMDGGAQAQLALKQSDRELIIPRFQMALPCVIGFFPVSDGDPGNPDPNPAPLR